MRLEDVPVSAGPMPPALPIGADLQALDAELEAAGRQARRMLNGQRQPTRYFSLGLRERFLEALASNGASAAGRGGQPGAASVTRR